MALEDTLLSIDATLKTLLTIAQSGATAAAELGETDAAAAKRKPGRPRKDEATDAAPKFDLIEGDAEGTRYFVVTKQHTVLKVAAGEAAPTIEGAQEIGGAKYLEWADTFAKKAATAQAEATKQPEAVKPAPTTDGAPSFKDVTEALMKMVKVEGLGRPALDKLMAEFGVSKVPAMEALKKNAEILARANALMNPPAEVAAAEDDPFAS